MRISDIVFEAGKYWVLREKNAYTVMSIGVTHSVSVQSFTPDNDGLSNAIAYCNFLEKRNHIED